MKYALALFVVLLAGCASEPVAYDQQFSTLSTVSSTGYERSHAWVIGPSLAQEVRFNRNAKK